MSGSEHDNSAERSPHFVYGPLQSGHIRLVRVEGWVGARVSCTIEPIDLETFESPWYALSYVWGIDGPTQEILLNGKISNVTPNLLAALTALDALQKRETFVALVWIDAISINQHDHQEKSEQVPLMARIFGKAGVVILWFGQLDDGEQTFVEVLTWLSAHMYLEEIGHSERESEQAEKSSQVLNALHGITVVQLRTLYIFLKLVEAWDMERKLGAPSDMTRGEAFKEFLRQCPHNTDLLPPRHPFWLSFLVFMHNDWFQRMWTMQEGLLACRRCLLLPGGLANGDLMLRCRDTFFGEHHAALWWVDSWPQYKALRRRGYTVDHIQASLSRTHVEIAPQSPNALPYALLGIKGLRATVAKDYIYGLLGLMDEETRSQLRVDYDASDASVFTHSVKVACSQKDAASTLPSLWEMYREVQSTVEGLPTWCPDFSNTIGKATTNSHFRLWRRAKAAYKPIARVDYECSEMAIRFAGIQLESVARSIGSCPHTSHEDVYAANEEQDSLKMFWAFFTERNITWLSRLYTFCTDQSDRSAAAFLALDKLCSSIPGSQISQPFTQERLQHLLHFTKGLQERLRSIE